MNIKNIIKSAANILKNESQEGPLTILPTTLCFIDSISGIQVTGEFAGLWADEYDEGFYYNIADGSYYYHGEAFNDNPGSFSNKCSFLIEGDDLNLLPEFLKVALKRVGQTRESETVSFLEFNEIS